MQKILVLLFFLAFILACGSSDGNNKSETKAEAIPATQGQVYLPSIPMDEIKILWDNCNQMDYLYYELPISMSLTDVYSIQQSLKHVSDTPVPLDVKNKCKAIARIFYKNSGEDLYEAEIYFSQGCTFFVFFKDGKPAYSNLMTNVGVKYFNDILEKAQKFQPKQ